MNAPGVITSFSSYNSMHEGKSLGAGGRYFIYDSYSVPIYTELGLKGRRESLIAGQGGAHDSNSVRYLFRVPMIHRFMTSHPFAELLVFFRAKHQDGRPMPFGFLVIFTHRLTELCILNAENVEKVSSRPFKQIS